jgi:hypothetical protein
MQHVLQLVSPPNFLAASNELPSDLAPIEPTIGGSSLGSGEGRIVRQPNTAEQGPSRALAVIFDMHVQYNLLLVYQELPSFFITATCLRLGPSYSDTWRSMTIHHIFYVPRYARPFPAVGAGDVSKMYYCCTSVRPWYATLHRNPPVYTQVS